MMLRTPTPLNSTDAQWGQCGGDTTYSSAIQTAASVFRGRRRTGQHLTSPFGGGHHELAVVATIGATGFSGGGNLFRRPDVGLREFHLFFCAGNLALMALRKSLVHIC